jgi:hypothetical protein
MSRTTKFGPGGNTSANSGNYNFNKYKGNQGIGATSISNYIALKRLAAFCKNNCPTPTIIPPTITTLVYSTSQGNSFIWGGFTFILNTALPLYSYSANITYIPTDSIPNNSFLRNTTIGNSVTAIASNAFQNYTSLRSIIIPSSVTSIGPGAFQGCSNLISITLPTNNLFTTISPDTFKDCISLVSIIIPVSVTSISDSAFEGCINLESIPQLPAP